MNCTRFEQRIALYVEGDLRESERARVETHMQSCAVCRDLAAELRESQLVFKGLRLGRVNSTVLADVRQRVLNEVGDMQPAPAWVIAMHRLIFAGLRRKTAIAGIALAALVSGGVWYETTIPPARWTVPVQVAKVEGPSAEVSSGATRPAVVTPRFQKRVKPHEVFEALPAELPAAQSIPDTAPPESEVSQVPMKFVTDDPDIIIYWLPSDKGD